MATHKKPDARTQEPVDASEVVTPQAAALVPVERDFAVINRKPREIKSVEITRPLTPPLIAMVHQGKLLFEAASDLTTMNLPVKGRSESIQPATVVEGYNLETGEYVVLICNTMMVSAFKKAGEPLKGKQFAIADNDLMADKNYRHIEVVQVAVELGDPLLEA